MAATETVLQVPISRKSPINKGGVLTLSGFGVRVRVHNGHLQIDDGVGLERRKISLPRVNHGLKRLVCISEDGFVTLSALKWIADQDASVVMLERTGKILFVTGPCSPSDSRLRRAQALGNGIGLEICRTLISAKLDAQEQVARERLRNPAVADEVAALRRKLPEADTFDAIRWLEAHAALAYFAPWHDVPVFWPKADLRRIPAHWLTIGSRRSPLSGGPRLAVTPVHAILNYCFALLEAESRRAIVALGLDPGLGLGLHTDTPNRDSLVFDVLEPVRPQVESWVLTWIAREPLRRADFFETPTGNCRLRSPLCAKLSETALTWGKLVAPWGEYVARTLWASTSPAKSERRLSTPLTQQHRRAAKGQFELPKVVAPRPQRACLGCGAALRGQKKHCFKCGVDISRANLIQIAHRGRELSRSRESLARLAAAQKRQNAARREWEPSRLPAWLTRDKYREMIWPQLVKSTVPNIANAMRVSESYATKVRKGLHVPHPMHWQTLAELVGVSSPDG